MLALGHLSPSVITPLDLRTLLIDIKEKLGTSARIPFDPYKDLWTFYRTMTCTTLIEDEQLVVVMSIPLLDMTDKLTIYKIHDLPLPLPGTNRTDISASFRLEARAIAVNSAQTQFATLTPDEILRCAKPTKVYCALQSPVYTALTNKMCVISLFMDKKDDVNKFCATVVYPKDAAPRAQYLTDGHWIVSYQTPLHFRYKCQNESADKTITTRSPVDVISLDIGCSASNDHMTLPPFYRHESHLNLTPTFQKLLNQYYFGLADLWKPITRKYPKIQTIKIPKRLVPFKQIPVDQLLNELDYEDYLNSNSTVSTSMILSLISISFWCFGIIYCFRHKIKNKCCKRSVKKGKMESSSAPSAPPADVLDLDRPWYGPVHYQTDTNRLSFNGFHFDDEIYGPDESLAERYLAEKYQSAASKQIDRTKTEVSPKTKKEVTPKVESEGPDDVVTVETDVRSNPLQKKPCKTGKESITLSMYPDLKRELQQP